MRVMSEGDGSNYLLRTVAAAVTATATFRPWGDGWAAASRHSEVGN